MNNNITRLADDDDLEYSEKVRLIRLIEECGEVIQAATKVLRFGPFNHHPDDVTKERNMDALERELNDLGKVASSLYPGIFCD